MTLDAAEVGQITEIAQRVAAEAIRNLARGTGGANTPIPAARPGTIGGGGGAGDQVLVRADGDVVAVPAVNATGQVVQSGDRVLISWLPPLGVYATHMLSGSSEGTWTPAFTGPLASNVNTSALALGRDRSPGPRGRASSTALRRRFVRHCALDHRPAVRHRNLRRHPGSYLHRSPVRGPRRDRHCLPRPVDRS